MTLKALVAAYDVEGGMLRAALPLAGVTLIEHQIRRLAAAGVDHPILLVEAMTSALAAPLARLRADGIAATVATSIADAADRLAAEPRVLILADACLPDRALVERIGVSPVPAVAVVPDIAELAAFERIDAAHRWAGLALMDGRRIADVAQMVGEWDPVSTMLRSAVQEGAHRIEAGRDVPVLAGSAETLRAAEQRLVAASREDARGWSDRFVEQPIAEALLPQLFIRRIAPAAPAIAAGVLGVLGALAALLGYRWPALLPLLLAGPLARMGERLALIQARRLPAARLLRTIRLVGMGAGAIGLGHGLWRADGQWGWLLAGLLPVAAAIGIDAAHRIVTWLGQAEEPAWLATPAALVWTLLPFALAGGWAWGLAAVAAYATGSFAWLLARAVKLAR